MALKPGDIDWRKKTIRIERAMTRDENDKPVEGPCKNKYRRRTIKLSSKMLSALKDQNEIYSRLNAKYFFVHQQVRCLIQAISEEMFGFRR